MLAPSLSMVDYDRIEQRLRDGEPRAQVAASYGICPYTLRYRLLQMGRQHSRTPRGVLTRQQARILGYTQAGLDVYAIAERIGTTVQTARVQVCVARRAVREASIVSP